MHKPTITGRVVYHLQAESAVVLFADISGSTQLYETLGDSRALEALGKCISALSQAVADNNGTVIKTIGDEVLATFPVAETAVLAAASMVQAVGQAFVEMADCFLVLGHRPTG